MWLSTLAASLTLALVAPGEAGILAEPLSEPVMEVIEAPDPPPPAQGDDSGTNPQIASVATTGVSVFVGGSALGLGLATFVAPLSIAGLAVIVFGLVAGPSIGYFMVDDNGWGFIGAGIRLLAFAGATAAELAAFLVIRMATPAILSLIVGAVAAIVGFWSVFDDLTDVPERAPSRATARRPWPEAAVVQAMPVLRLRF